MKGILIFYLFSFSLFISSNSKVEWMTPIVHDFGDIKQSNPVQFDFQFKNISGAPLIIDNVRTTCGCTTPNWTIEPIPINGNNKIEVIYDAKKLGYFRKKIKVFFNGQRKPEVLSIEGFVE